MRQIKLLHRLLLTYSQAIPPKVSRYSAWEAFVSVVERAHPQSSSFRDSRTPIHC
jgi:hypothetical protein